MAKFKPGQSGNSRGRPRGALNKIAGTKEFKKTLVGVSKEALENIIDLMRTNKRLADEILSQAQDLDEAIQDAEADGNVDLVKSLKAERKALQQEAVGAKEASGKYSLRILDYVYSITVHEDNLQIKRHKAQLDDDSGLDDRDEDDDGMPLVSVVPIKNGAKK